MRSVMRFLISEDGPTAVEYAVMIGMILLAVMVTVGQMAAKTGDLFDHCGAELDAVGF